LIALARERNRVLAVGHELRLSSLWGKVKELIDAGAIGEPLYAFIELWRRPYRLGSGGWRYDLGRVGNWTLEEPIHFFDLARWYFAGVGEPVSVYAAANGKRPDQPELHDNFSAVIHFPRGRYAVISQTLAAWEHHQTAKVTGTDGALWAGWSGATDRTFEPTFRLQLQRGDALEEVRIEKPAGEVYELVEQVARVARAVRDGTPVACTGADGRESVALCLAAEESLRTGQPVTLPRS
jgi:myo-inositol 2-dehydrogenase/D-chiro-inositol 1-dehydrogenase